MGVINLKELVKGGEEVDELKRKQAQAKEEVSRRHVVGKKCRLLQRKEPGSTEGFPPPEGVSSSPGSTPLVIDVDLRQRPEAWCSGAGCKRPSPPGSREQPGGGAAGMEREDVAMKVLLRGCRISSGREEEPHVLLGARAHTHTRALSKLPSFQSAVEGDDA